MNAIINSIEELQEAVLNFRAILPRGGGTKTALSTPMDNVTGVELNALAGILEYQPEEYTFTALAGSRIEDVKQVLADNGQYLPFDPPMAKRGATLGGTVAAGLSGPGRYHYGGVRDFLLGVSFVNSQGKLVRGGGKVVKNAAGFDLPKLMVGSLGAFGIMVELTFKVFPKPARLTTVRKRYQTIEQALQGMHVASSARLELDALELWPTPEGYHLLIRLGGLEKALQARLERLSKALEGFEVLQDQEQDRIWEEMDEFSWVPDGHALIKVPITPGKLSVFDAAMRDRSTLRRYSAGGQLAWIAPDSLAGSMDDLFRAQRLTGLVIWGPAGAPRLGERKGIPFHQRIKTALDPEFRFVEA